MLRSRITRFTVSSWMRFLVCRRQFREVEGDVQTIRIGIIPSGTYVNPLSSRTVDNSSSLPYVPIPKEAEILTDARRFPLSKQKRIPRHMSTGIPVTLCRTEAITAASTGTRTTLRPPAGRKRSVLFSAANGLNLRRHYYKIYRMLCRRKKQGRQCSQ